jgi:TRAP-type C4-dicarboxylate transport system permease small subunit
MKSKDQKRREADERNAHWASLILYAVVLYATFLLLSFGWGYVIGAGLTWMGLLSSPLYAVWFFLILNHLALILHILVGFNRDRRLYR